MKQFFTLLTALFVLAFTQNVQSQTYVNAAAMGNNDGTSWANAYTELADALDTYNANDEIWVAAGTYLPQNPTAWADDEKQTFYLYQNVSLYGGFNGTETMLTERDPIANSTILSGDMNGDDVDDDFETNREDNVLNVVFIEAAASNSIIDGFTISSGHADGEDTDLQNIRGGGLFTYGTVEIKNCIVEQNFSVRQGGAFYFRDMASSGSTVENCIFQKNRTANVAGGIGMWDTRDIIVVDCEFIQNEAGDFAGGGIAMAMSSANISGCDFIENSGTNNAGALLFDNFDMTGLELSVTDCYFENNTAVKGGAFTFLSSGGGDCDILISGCEFTDNTATAPPFTVFSGGGALGFEYTAGNPTNDTIMILDCAFDNNAAEPFGGAILFINEFGTENFFHLSSCDFNGNRATDAGGAFGYASLENNSDILVSDCTFTNNEADAAGGIIYQTNGTNTDFTIKNCDFVGNKSTGTGTTPGGLDNAGGAVSVYFTSILASPNNHATIDSCNFENNEAELFGGGLFVADLSNNNSVDVLNSTFVSNTAVYGGGIQTNAEGENFQMHLSNCDYTGNQASEFGGGFRVQSTDPNLQMSHDNCLFDSNVADVDGGGLEVVHYVQGDGETTIHNTDFLNNTSGNHGAGLNFALEGQGNGSLVVESALFSGNVNDATGDAEFGAGGFSLNNLGTGTANVNIQSSIFENNTSEDGAGGIQLFNNGTTTNIVTIENTLLKNNTGGEYGGGIGVEGNIDLQIKSSTIADNINEGIVLSIGSLTMQNTILSNPLTDNFMAINDGSATSVGGNLVSDATMDGILTAIDQSETDPLFATDSYQLSANSLAIDAGLLLDDAPMFDLAGNDRIQGGCLDIGAYESEFDAGISCLTDTREVLAAPSTIAIYPNPVAETVNIALENDWQGGLNLRIVNALGQVVEILEIEKRSPSFLLDIEVSDLPIGIYQVLISNGEMLAVSSFVKK